MKICTCVLVFFCSCLLNLLHFKTSFSAPSELFETTCPWFAFVPFHITCVWCRAIETVCVAHPFFSTIYVTLCLRYSMYWFPRYNVSFRQNFSGRRGHTVYQDAGQGNFSKSDEEGVIARRRVPRRTSSEIASAKIAGRSIPGKVRKVQVKVALFVT